MRKTANTQDLHSVIIGLLAQLPAETLLQISNASFHKAVQEIQSHHPQLFRGLAFSRNTSNPWSYPLESIIFCLGASRLLSRSCIGEWFLSSMLREGFEAEHSAAFSQEELLIIMKEGRNLTERIRRGELAPRQLST